MVDHKALPIIGGCLCGAIRYIAVEPPISAGHCHCVNCRKHTGAAFATDATFRASAFSWAGAEPTYYASSAACSRSFCGTCGSTVSAKYVDLPHLVIVAAGTLDDPNVIAPKLHAFTRSRLTWIKLCDGLTEYPVDIPNFGKDVVG